MKKEELDNIIEIVKKKNEQNLIHIILTLIDGNTIELYYGEEFQFNKDDEHTINNSYNNIEVISSGIIVSRETVWRPKTISSEYTHKGYNSKYIPLNSIISIEFKKLLLENITVDGFTLTAGEYFVRDDNWKK